MPIKIDKLSIYIRHATHYIDELEIFLDSYEESENKLGLRTEFEFEILPHVRTAIANLREHGEDNEDALAIAMGLSVIRPGTMSNLLSTTEFIAHITHGIELYDDLLLLHPVGNIFEQQEAQLLYAEMLRTRASVAALGGFTEAAIEDFRQSIKECRALSWEITPEAISMCVAGLSGLGDLYRVLGQHNESYEVLEEAVNLVKKYELTDSKAIPALNNMALLLDALGRHDEARQLMGSIDVGMMNEADQVFAQINQLFMTYQATRDPHVFAELESMIEEVRQGDDHTELATLLNNLGEFIRQEGDVNTALEYFEEVVSLNRKTNNLWMLAFTLSNISLCYLQLGQIDDAYAKVDEAYSISEQVKSDKGMAIVLNTKATIELNLGNFDKALQYYDESLRFRQHIGDIAQCEMNIGNVYFGKYQRIEPRDIKYVHTAVEYLDKALRKFEQLKDETRIATVKVNLGECNRILANYIKSKNLFEEALPVIIHSKNNKALAHLYNNFGTLYYDMKDVEQARHYVHQAIELQVKINDFIPLVTSYINLIRLEADQNNKAEAIDIGHKAIELIKKIDMFQLVGYVLEPIFEIVFNYPPPWTDWVDLLELVLPMVIKLELTESVTIISSILSNTYTLIGRHDKVISLSNKIITYAMQHREYDLQAAMLANRASAHLLRYENSETCNALKMLIWLIETYQLDPTKWSGLPVEFYKNKYEELNC